MKKIITKADFLIIAGALTIAAAVFFIAGACFHNAGQIIAASIVFSTVKIVYYLPFLFVSGVVTGIVTGLIVKFL